MPIDRINGIYRPTLINFGLVHYFVSFVLFGKFIKQNVQSILKIRPMNFKKIFSKTKNKSNVIRG